MTSQNDELIGIITKFAESGWNTIDIPSKAWLQIEDDNKISKAKKLDLISAIEKAERECGNCGCEYDVLYQRALVLLKTI